MAGMQIHSWRHAKLEINYLEQKGALDDQLDRACTAPFKDEAEINAWKDNFRKSAEPVFVPLNNYFERRAIGQKLLMLAGAVPMLAGAISALGTGGAGPGLLVGGIGFVIVMKASRGVEDAYQQVAALFNQKMELLRGADQVAQMRIHKLTAPPPAPPAPAAPTPSAPSQAAPSPQPAATQPVVQTSVAASSQQPGAAPQARQQPGAAPQQPSAQAQ